MDHMQNFYETCILEDPNSSFGLLAKADLESTSFDEFLGWLDW
jgi:hypothetical protein